MRSGRKNRSITNPQTDLVHHRAAFPLNLTQHVDFGLTRALTIFDLEEWRAARGGRRQSGGHHRLRENFPFSLHPTTVQFGRPEESMERLDPPAPRSRLAESFPREAPGPSRSRFLIPS